MLRCIARLATGGCLGVLLAWPGPGFAGVTFSASFEHGVDADRAAGRAGAFTLGQTRVVEHGRRGGALWVPPLDVARFDAEGNLPLEQGTLDLWIRPRPAELERHGRAVSDHQTIWMTGVTRDPYLLQLRLQGASAATAERPAQWRLAVLAANGSPASKPVFTAALPDWETGGWRHLALTWRRPGTLKLYLDGEVIGATDGAALPTVDAADLKDMYFGTNVNQSAHAQLEHFDGLIDEVRIQDRFDAVSATPKQYASAPPPRAVRVRDAAGDGPRWVGPQRYRVQVELPAAQGEWQRTPAAVEIDFDRLLREATGSNAKLARPSLRLVRHDPATGEPVVSNPQAEGEAAYYQPFTLNDAFDAADAGLMQWIREGSGEAAYCLYFDTEPHPGLAMPSELPMVGNGDRLRLGSAGDTGPLSLGAWSALGAHDFDGDGDLDLWVNSGFLVRANQHLRNGQYYLENLGQDAQGRPLFAAPRRIPGGYGNYPFGVFHGTMCPVFTDIDGDGAVDLLYVGEWGQAWAELTWSGDRPAIGRWRPIDLGTGEKPAKLRPATYIDWNGDGLREFVAGPYVYPNLGTDTEPRFHHETREPLLADGKPLDTSLIAGHRYLPVDWDSDGDLDLIVGGTLHWILYFENIGSRSQPELTARGVLRTDEGDELDLPGALIRPIVVDFDGDGDLDLVWGNENGQVGFNENIASPGEAPRLRQTVYAQQHEPVLDAGTIVIPVATDWDDDGDLDLITGASDEYLLFFENAGTQAAPRWKEGVRLEAGGEVISLAPGYDGSVQGKYEAHWGYCNPAVVDWDGDGLNDLLVSGTRGEHLFFRNAGRRGEPRLEPARKLTVAWGDAGQQAPAWVPFTPEPDTLVTVWRSRPVPTDWDGDGLVDYIALDHEGKLALYPRQRADNGDLILLPGERRFEWDLGTSGFMIWNRRPGAKAGGSGRTVLNLVDWDGDGDRDLITDGLNARLFENVADDERPRFEDRGDLVDERLANHNSGPEVVDWDGDGRHDLLLGAEDGHVYYFHRSYIEGDAPVGEVIALERRQDD